MSNEAETREFLATLEVDSPASPNDQLVPPGERPCPICGVKMVIEVQHGVSLDVCQNHGVWLDRGELPVLASRIRAGERISRLQVIRDARREGKLGGMVVGAWALMTDD